MGTVSKTKKFGHSPVAAACVALVVGFATSGAMAQSATFGVNYAASTPSTNATINLYGVNSPYALSQDFTTVTGLAGFQIPVQSVQTLYSAATNTLTAGVDLTVGAGGILNEQNGNGTVTSNVSDNSIAASGVGNQLTLVSGSTPATIDLGLLSTGNRIGALAVQFLGGQTTTGKVNVQANVSGSTVGVLFNGLYAAPLAVNRNTIKASSTLNDATTLVAGAVPLGFSDSTGGSSSINFAGTATTGGGTVGGSSTATLSLNTLQSSVNGGITDGSHAQLVDNTIALKTQRTGAHNEVINSAWVPVYPDLSSPLTLNNNAQSASFTGNNATSVLQADASSNAFSGSASVVNAQANVETLDFASASRSPTALVSNSQIVADLTYAGVDGAGASPTSLTSSLSVSGTAAAPQSISAQSIGNAAGTLNSAGQITSAGNAVEFSNSTVDLTGSGNQATLASATPATSQSVGGDVLVNSAQINQRPNDSGSGVTSLVEGSGITAAVDRLAASGSVAVNHDALTAGATGNLAGNLINAQANNIRASMTVLGTQQNINAGVAAGNLNSLIGVGIGDAAVTTAYTVDGRAATTNVSGSVTADNNAIGAVAQGNLGANNLLAAAGNTLTAQYNNYWGEDSVENTVNSTGVYTNAGLIAINLQGNTGSAASATVSGGSVFVAGVDQAGTNQGSLVPLGAASLSASSNRISALAQGNNGGAVVNASAGGALALTAASANLQNNDSNSAVTANVFDSSVLVTGLSALGTTITTQGNTLTADAAGNLAANGIAISGGATVDGQASAYTSDLTSGQNNAAAIAASASGSAVGVRLGAGSTNAATTAYGYPSTAAATIGVGEVYVSDANSSTGNAGTTFASMTDQNVTTVSGATLAVDASTVAAQASGNQASNSASMAGTTLGGIAPVGSGLYNRQNNAGAVSGSVSSTDVGVRLVGQSLSYDSTPTFTNTASTTNTFDTVTGAPQYVNVDLTSAKAVASNGVSASGSGNITAIDSTTASVSGSQLIAAAQGNAATNALSIQGADVTLMALATPANMYNQQLNDNAGAIGAQVTGADVGALVGGVTGTGTSTLTGTVTATVQPTMTYTGPAGLFSGSGSATIGMLVDASLTPVTVVGSMEAVGINALNATVDNSTITASSVANSADNRINVSATKLSAPANATALVSNVQSNYGAFGGSINGVNLGVVLSGVSSDQTTTASGASTATVTTTSNSAGASIADGPAVNAWMSASGSSTALGVSGSTTSVQGSALSASATGNTVTNVIDLASTAADHLGAKIVNNDGDVAGQVNTGAGSATIAGVALGSITGAVDATSTTTTTVSALGSASATDATTAYAGNNGLTGGSAVNSGAAMTSGSATTVADATGLSGSTATVSGNSLKADVYGNDAINVVSGSGTALSALSGQSAASVVNDQYNNGALTAAVGNAEAGVQLGTIVGAVSATGTAKTSSTASGSSVALATDGGTNGEKTVAAFTSTAIANADATVNATGITGLVAGVDSNTLQATNTGNNAVNAIRLASTTLGGSAGAATLDNTNHQVNLGAGLSATVDNVALGVMVASVDATASASGSSSAVSSSTATDYNTASWASGSSSYVSNTADAVASSTAGTGVSGSATALGIDATQASVASNVLRAVNIGNKASTVTSLSASTLSGVAGPYTVAGSNSQTNSAALGASLGADMGVVVGVSGGAVTASFTGSGSASAASTTDATAYNYSTYWNGSSNVNSSTDTGYSALVDSTANASVTGTATATGINGSTLSVLSNQLDASNMGNSATTLAVIDGTLLGTGTAPVSVAQTSSQTNTGHGTASVGNLMLGVAQANVLASASGSASYTSSPSLAPYGQLGSGSNTVRTTATAYGIVGSDLSVGGTAVAPQTVTAQSVGNSASTLVAVTQTTGSGASGSAALTVSGYQNNYGAQDATIGGSLSPVTVGVKVGAVTATTDSNVAQQRYTSGAPYYSSVWDENATSTAVGISGGSAAVQYNQLAAKTYGNSAVNGVTSSTATTLAGSNANVATLSASNAQTNQSAGATTSTVSSADIGVVVGSVSADVLSSYWWTANAAAINAAEINVSNNSSLALGIGNVADNSVLASATVAGSSALPLSSLTTSTQTNDGAQTALVDALRVGVITGSVWGEDSAYGLRNSSVTVAGNKLQAATYGNSANNLNQVAASSSANVGAIVTRNTQDNGVGGVGPSTVSNTTVGVDVGSLSSWNTWALANTPVTVQSNTLAALSYGNAATNATSVSGGTTVAAGSAPTAYQTLNGQTNGAAMSSTATGINVGVVTRNYVDSSPLTIKGNAVSAMSYGNQSTNSLSLTAGNTMDGAGSLATVNSTQANWAAGVADATVSGVNVGVVGSYIDVGNTPITVDGNTLTAASYLNTANNSLNLAAQTLDHTPATVSNAQTNAAAGSGTISDVNVGAVPAGGPGSNSSRMSSVSSSVSNNALNAQAGGNTASNVLNATASTTVAGSPTFQVLNNQSNTGVMTASLNNAAVGNWGSTYSSYSGTTMTVSMNSAVANAYGNTASNAVNMSALTGASNSAYAALSNSQNNTAGMSATVTGVQIGVGSGYGQGTVGVSGNRIAASTVGNAASNQVGIAR